MIAPRIRGALSVFGVLAAAACGGGSSEPTTNNSTTPTAVAIVSGNGQTGIVGTTLSLPLVVKVTSANGTAISGAGVTFAVTSGAATVSPSSTTTDASGTARTTVTLGSSAGSVSITATVAGTALSTVFTVSAGTTVVSSACTGVTPQTPAAGGVLPGVGGTGICLGGASGGSDYALVIFNSTNDSASVANNAAASLTVKSTGATALTTADAAPAFGEAPLGSTLGSPLRAGATDLQSAFDLHLRETARRVLTPLIPSAQAQYKLRAAATVIPSNPTIGQMITLNTNQDPCTRITNVRARIAAITSTAIIAADSLNPTGGFTDAEYASFGVTFDTLVNQVDVSNFGQPSDIDKNGKVLILFTKEVNKLTPRGSGGFVGGFVHERDLFPITSTATLEGCAGSNFGEMAYLLVPDPNAVFGDARSKADVLSNTIGTLAHEYQHMINAGRRLYVNNILDFEDVWLNEGLSHIAEELIYYREAGRSPRQNIGITQIQTDQNSVTAYNQFQADNFGRYEEFLAKPARTSVYGYNDSLSTRGATWNLLRYLADHRGSSDGDTWSLLVNSRTYGHKNLAAVFGPTYMTQIRDWATSVFSDDVLGVTDARFIEPSWNMRNIFPALCVNSTCTIKLGKFPLAVTGLSDASPANLSIIPGGEAYLRFTVAAGSQASIDWSAGGLPVSPLVQFTVVRTR